MLTTKEAGDILGVSPRRITALIASGALKAERLGRSWAVDESSVQERATAERLRGRPKAFHIDVPDRGRFILMSHDHEVLHFIYNSRTGEVSELELRDGIAWKPIGIGAIDRKPNPYDFALWLRNRAIPSVRPHLPAALHELAVSTPSALMFKSWGLSLTDPYWFKPDGVDVSWDDINYFDQGYEETFGAFMLGERDRTVFKTQKESPDDVNPKAEVNVFDRNPAITHSPDTATNGMLSKTWIRRHGHDYLIKSGTGNENREPYNEKLATCLLRRLLDADEFVAYDVVEHQGRAYSSCVSMIDAEIELIPAHDVLTAFAVSEGRDLHRGYMRALGELEVPQGQRLIDKMIVVDYLMANFDRHTHNFGIIRNVERLDEYRIAPLFDHGCSFYSRATTAELESRPYVWESHPFREYPSQQLALIEDLDWYDPSSLDGFLDDISDILGQNPEMSERFITAVQKQTTHQIQAVNALAAERGLIVAGW